jgi:hypothetical protein
MFRFRADDFLKSADPLLRILKNDRIAISKFPKKFASAAGDKKTFRFRA